MVVGFVGGIGGGNRRDVRGGREVVCRAGPGKFKFPRSPDDEVEAARLRLTDQFSREEKQDKEFDGYKLRDLLLEKYGRCYDIQLKATPWFNGKSLITVNIMWKYFEQQSFPLEEEDYLCHLEAISQYLKKWNSVEYFIKYVRETREKPRVGKALAVPIDVSPEMLRDFEKEVED